MTVATITDTSHMSKNGQTARYTLLRRVVVGLSITLVYKIENFFCKVNQSIFRPCTLKKYKRVYYYYLCKKKMCVTGRRRRGKPHKVYIFLISIKILFFFGIFEVASTFLNICPFLINRFDQPSTQTKGK